MNASHHVRHLGRWVIVGALSLTAAACAAAPRVRPVKGADVDTGPGSAEFVRRQLSGQWLLTSLTIYSASGQPTNVPAEAELNYDEFGNLKILGQVKNGTPGDPPPILQLGGRAVIDAPKGQLRLVDTGSDVIDSAVLSQAISYDRIRLYEISGQTLTLKTIDADGKPTATTVWRRP